MKPKGPFSKISTSLLVNISLLALSTFSFGMFAWNVYKTQNDLENSGGLRVAKLSRGTLDQKRFGAIKFSRAAVGSSLYNQDALWVPKGQDALIQFFNGTVLHLNPETFIILKKGLGLALNPGGAFDTASVQIMRGSAEATPPRSLFSGVFGGAPALQIQNQHGDVSTLAANGQTKGLNSTQGVKTEGTPDASPAPSPLAPSPEPSHLEAPGLLAAKVTFKNPRPIAGTYFLVTEKMKAEIPFSWWPAWTGKLLITKTAKGKEEPVLSMPLQDATGAKAILNVEPEGTYSWALLNPDGKVVYGPSEVRVLPFDQKQLEEIIRVDPKRTIEVIE